MSIEKLVERSIISDLRLVTLLAAYVPLPHDHDGRAAGDDGPGEEERLATIAVSAHDLGEFHPGTGIHRVQVQVDIATNALANGTPAELLDLLASAVDSRLQPSTQMAGVVGREAAFSNANLHVLGILSGETPREEIDFIRERVITRTFIAADITGGAEPVDLDDATLRIGEGVPDDSVGIDGDYYLNLLTWDLYLKVAGTYF